jgi:hypothetical protein
MAAPARRAIALVATTAFAASLMGASKLEPPVRGVQDSQPLVSEQATKPSQAKGQQLRCWQYGRLIIDVPDVEVPPGSPSYTLELHTAGRVPVYLVQAGTSTCLIQRPAAERARPAGRK